MNDITGKRVNDGAVFEIVLAFDPNTKRRFFVKDCDLQPMHLAILGEKEKGEQDEVQQGVVDNPDSQTSSTDSSDNSG